MPTKIGLHAFQANLYLHENFEPILFFDHHGLYSHGPNGNLARNSVASLVVVV